MWVNNPTQTEQSGQQNSYSADVNQNSGANDFTPSQGVETTMYRPSRYPPPRNIVRAVDVAKLAEARQDVVKSRTLNDATPAELLQVFISACRNSDIETVQKCLELGVEVRKASFNFTTSNGECEGNIIHALATQAKFNDLLQCILSHDPELIHLQDEVGDTMLHYAALKNAYKNADTLIRAGIDPKITNKAGITALKLAQDKDNTRMISTIKDAYSALNSKDGFQKENDHMISRTEVLGAGDISLRTIFNFATREITTISENAMTVQQFDEISHQSRIKEAAEVLEALKGKPGNWQSYKSVTPLPKRVK